MMGPIWASMMGYEGRSGERQLIQSQIPQGQSWLLDRGTPSRLSYADMRPIRHLSHSFQDP